MRILMVHPHDIYSYLEPWTIRIRSLAKELVERGHEVRLIYHVLDPEYPLEEAARRQDFPYHTVPLYRGQPAPHDRSSLFLPHCEWADVVHFQKCFPYASLPVVDAARQAGKPVHYDWDDWEYQIYNFEPPSRVVGVNLNLLERSLPSLVDTLSVASAALYDLAVELGFPPADIYFAPVGADLERYHPDNRRHVQEIRDLHDLEGPIVLYLGQLHGAQYAELMIRAGRQVLQRHPEANLLVVGGGYRLARLHEIAEELGMGHQIIFTGPVADDLVPKYIAAADVAVACFEDNLQTRTKSPLKVCEYLASGRPIVASRMGEVASMVEGAGVLVKPGDADDLARGINELLDDPERSATLGERARRRAELKWNWGTPAEQLVKAYRKCMQFQLDRDQRSGIVRSLASLWKPAKRLVEFVDNNRDLLGVLDGEESFRGPSLIQIDPTNSCNNRCIACWCHSPLLGEKGMPEWEKTKQLDKEVLATLVDDVAALGTKEVYLAGGGEPFMYRHIDWLLELLAEKQIVVYLNSNFTLIDEKRAVRMVDLGVQHVTLSMWAGTAAGYVSTHPSKTSEDFRRLTDIVTGINRLKAERGAQYPLFKVYQVLSNLNYFEILEMIEWAYDTGCESVEFTLLDTIPGKTDALRLTPAEQEECLALCERAMEYVEERNRTARKPLHLFRQDQFLRRLSSPNVSDAEYDRNIIDAYPCTIGWSFARVVADGSVHFCLKAHRAPVGNINETRFADIWTSEKLRYFRKKANVFVKDDPFFSLIGNDPTAACGCYRSCDDLGRNQHVHERLESLSWYERTVLDGARVLLKATGNNLRPRAS